MLKEAFPHLVSKKELPQSEKIWEGSRFCVEATLDPDTRKRIVQELVIGYLEFALEKNITSIIGVMYPVYWKNIFIKSGWNVEWLGELHKSEEGYKIIAGELKVSKEVLAHVREITNIHSPVLSYGIEEIRSQKVA
jgi:acyl homoserine lactone synthase